MKRRQSGQDKEEPFPSCHRFLLPALLITLVLGFFSCENDMDKIRTVTLMDQMPNAAGKQYEILYSDSFRVKVRILAPEIQRYATIEEPYIEFPKGMTAYFYDDSLDINAYIKAKHVIYLENKYLWEAKNDVEARNLDNNSQINSEHMFWDEQRDLIYSNTYSRIVNEDGTFYGDQGFEAKQDLSWYRLKKSTGVVNLKDE